MWYKVYFSENYNEKGKLIGAAHTAAAAIDLGASYQAAGYFSVWDIANGQWLEV